MGFLSILEKVLLIQDTFEVAGSLIVSLYGIQYDHEIFIMAIP